MQRCPVCVHSAREEIEAEVSRKRSSGESYQAIADRHGVKRHTVVNHERRCMGTKRSARGAKIGPPIRAQGSGHRARSGPECRVCESPIRTEIEQRLLAGEPARRIEAWTETLGDRISDTAITHHLRTHVPAVLAEREETRAHRDTISRDALEKRMAQLVIEAHVLGQRARAQGGSSLRLALKALETEAMILDRVCRFMFPQGLEISLAQNGQVQDLLRRILDVISTPGRATGPELADLIVQAVQE